MATFELELLRRNARAALQALIDQAGRLYEQAEGASRDAEARELHALTVWLDLSRGQPPRRRLFAAVAR